MTAFRLISVDIDRATEPVPLAPLEDGVGVVVRVRGRPVGFALYDMPPGATLSTRQVTDLAGRIGAPGIMIDAVRDELRCAIGEQPPKPYTVTVAICTHNRPALLERVLHSLLAMRRATKAPERLREILVVDNAPPDDSTAHVASAAGVAYVREPIAGLDVARNTAWRAAHGDYVAFLDDDVVVDPHWLDGLSRALTQHPDAAGITGIVLPYRLDTEARVLFERGGGFRRGFTPIRWRGATRTGDLHFPFGSGEYGAGCNMVLRRDVLERLEGFDPALDAGSFLPGGGDLDIFARILLTGHPLIYEPTMAVYHEHRGTIDQLRAQYHSWGLGFFSFLHKAWITFPQRRRSIRGLGRWWILWMVRRLINRARGIESMPAEMLIAQIEGAVDALTGEYSRSRARMAEILSRRRS